LEDEIMGEVVSILRDGHRIEPSPAWWHGAGRFILRRSRLSARVLLGLRQLRRRRPPKSHATSSASCRQSIL
jgi:hypothetical protein